MTSYCKINYTFKISAEAGHLTHLAVRAGIGR
jgi:hypothetical protein